MNTSKIETPLPRLEVAEASIIKFMKDFYNSESTDNIEIPIDWFSFVFHKSKDKTPPVQLQNTWVENGVPFSIGMLMIYEGGMIFNPNLFLKTVMTQSELKQILDEYESMDETMFSLSYSPGIFQYKTSKFDSFLANQSIMMRMLSQKLKEIKLPS